MASWRPVYSHRLYSAVSEQLQLVSYVRLKNTAGSGGVILLLAQTKLFLPVVILVKYLFHCFKTVDESNSARVLILKGCEPIKLTILHLLNILDLF